MGTSWKHNNFIPADPLKTPEHIAPLWYFTPFYAILRAVPSIAGSAFPGVLAMFLAILVMFFMPWLDRSPVKSIRYRGNLYKIARCCSLSVSSCWAGWVWSSHRR